MTGTEIVRAADVDIDGLKKLAQMLAVSGYFEITRGDPAVAVAQMATKILAGREMGYGPFASVQGIHVIQGKPALSANIMASAVKGHPRYDYRVREMTTDICRIEFFEVLDGKRESIGVSEFTAKDARAAGTKNMDKYPRNMLFARAMSNGVKWFCPDVFNGNAVYVPEELGADVDGEGNVIDVQPAPMRQNGGAQHTESNGAGVAATVASDPAIPAPTIPAVALRKLHAVGVELYGANWDTKRHEIVRKITQGRTESSKELSIAELDRMMTGMEAKLKAQRQAAEIVADVMAGEELAH